MLSQQVKEIVDWLPTDSETLMVANHPFELTGAIYDSNSFLNVVRGSCFGLVWSFQDNILKELLQGQLVTLAVEGSRRFTSPTSLGPMAFEGCQIVCFDERSHKSVEAAAETCLLNATNTIQIDKTKVAVFVTRVELDEWTLLLAQPQPGMLLCATNQNYLEQVLARMQVKQADRAFPDQLPEWEYLNFKAPVWSIRHYRKEFAQTDNTSPLNEVYSEFPDDGAIGFVFWFDPQIDQNAHIIYLSKSKGMFDIMTSIWYQPDENLTPEIRETKPGVIEITAPVHGTVDSWGMFVFVSQWYLGHGVNL